MALACLAASGAALAPAATAAPLTYQINPAHSGFVNDREFVPPLRKRWSRPLGLALSYPVIARGRVYVTVKTSEDDYGTKLVALDARDGSLLWERDLGGLWWWSALAYDAGRVFTNDANGTLRAFDAVTGDQQWSTHVPGHNHPPVAADGMVYAGGYGGETARAVAIRQEDGSRVWSTDVIGSSNSAPALDGQRIYFSWTCPHVWALSRATGAVEWATRPACHGGGGFTPALHNGKLYVRDWSSGKHVYDAASGQRLGSFSGARIPAFAGDTFLTITGSGAGGALVAWDERTGLERWRLERQTLASLPPVVVGDYAYAATPEGDLHAVDVATGTPAWSENVGGRVRAPDEEQVAWPHAGYGAGERLLLIPAGGTLVAYESVSAPPADITPPTAPSISSPANNSYDTDGSFSVRGTAEPGATVELYEGTTLKGRAAAAADGRWSVALTGVADGRHTYTATATDAAENVSAASAPRMVIVDTTRPRVTTVAPAPAAVGVSLRANAFATFSQPMRPSSITRITVKLVRMGRTTPVSATVTYDPTRRRANLDPTNRLARGAVYNATVTTGARDLAGNPLARTTTWSFRTRR